MALTLYDLVGRDDSRFSPNCWRIRLALAHMELAPDEIVPIGFTEKDKIAFSGGKTIPILVDGDTNVRESWDIANYLVDTYPDRPALWHGAEGRNHARFVNLWADQALHPALFPVIVADVHAAARDADQAYFRESREARLSRSLEEVTADRGAYIAALEKVLGPLRTLLGEQDFVCGSAPAYGDYIVFGAFQWARCTSPLTLLAADDPIFAWRERLLSLYDGLARAEKAMS
jgi:glutathione S-transferase